MLIRIEEIAGIASPEGRLGRLYHLGTGSCRLFYDCSDLLRAVHIVAKRELSGTRRTLRNCRIMGNVVALPNREFQARLKIKESDRPMFKLLSNDSFSREAHAVAVERERLFQIVHAKCNDGDSWLHIVSSILTSLEPLSHLRPIRMRPPLLPTSVCFLFVWIEIRWSSHQAFVPWHVSGCNRT